MDEEPEMTEYIPSDTLEAALADAAVLRDEMRELADKAGYATIEEWRDAAVRRSE